MSDKSRLYWASLFTYHVSLFTSLAPICVNLRSSAVCLSSRPFAVLFEAIPAGNRLDDACLEPIEIATENSLCEPIAAPINIVSSAEEQPLDT